MYSSSITYPSSVGFDGELSLLSWKKKAILATIIVISGGIVASFFPNRDPIQTDAPTLATPIRKQANVAHTTKLATVVPLAPIESAENEILLKTESRVTASETAQDDIDLDESAGFILADVAPKYAGNGDVDESNPQSVESQKMYGEYLQPPKMDTLLPKKESSPEMVSVRKPSLRISRGDFEPTVSIKPLNTLEKRDPMSRWESSFDEEAPLSKPRPLAKIPVNKLVIRGKSLASISADQIMGSQPRPQYTRPIASISADAVMSEQ